MSGSKQGSQEPVLSTFDPAGRRLGRVRGWILRQLAEERDRWILWWPVLFGAGIALYFAWPSEPPGWLGPAALIGALALALAGRRRPRSAIAALAIAALAAGFADAQWRSHQVAAPVLAKRLGPVAVSGQIRSLSVNPEGGRIVLQDLLIERLSPAATPRRIRLRYGGKDTEAFGPGDRVRLLAVLQPPPAPAAPGAFDFARQAYFQRIGAVGYAVSALTRIAAPPGRAPSEAAWLATIHADWQLLWASWRRAVAQRVLAALPGAVGGIAAALMTGERGAIPREVIAAMRESGLAHLLAISGLHMGLVAGWLFFAVRLALALVPTLALNHPIKKWAAIAAACGGLGYLILVGATIPAQRAFIMVLLALLAVLLDRNPFSLRLVAWAAFVVLALVPESLLSVSFQMSFAAVAALIAGYEIVVARGWFTAAAGGGSFGGDGSFGRGWLGRGGLYLAGVLLTSVIAILATAPFAVYHFNRMAWFGLAANLIAVPLTGLWIMPCALVAFLLMPFGLEVIALVPMGWGIEVIIAVARRVAAWPGAVTAVRALPEAGLVLILAGGLWLCIWRRPWRLAGLPLLAAGLLSLLWLRPPDLLISGDAKLIGLRDDTGRLWVSSDRRARYTAETWARRAGLAAAAAWPRDAEALRGQLRCDAVGCIFRARGQIVALVENPRGLAEDCALAGVLISLEPLARRDCRLPAVVIDRFAIWREGAHALWLSPEGVRVETVRERRGARPWAPERRREWDD